MDMVALELVRNLQLLDQENEYVVFVKPDEDDQVIFDSPNMKIVRLEGGSYPQWEQVALPRAARREGCDMLHCTSNTAPVFPGMPLVVTLHDIIYMEHSWSAILQGSGTPYQKFGNLYRRWVVPRVLTKSSAIVTVSHFEKNRIAEFFGMEGDSRLRAVYNGVGTHFSPVLDSVELERVRIRYKLPSDFFFFLGNTDPKKNTKGTLLAFSNFLKKSNEDIFLVMLDYDLAELRKLLDEIGDPDLLEKIILTGYVVNTDLPAIYSQSRIFLYPSLRESFGIPMLEAMACGVPVITSNTSSMPEVAGGAALLVNPFDPDEITNAMQLLTSEPVQTRQLVVSGLERAKAFSWRNMAIQVLDIYREIGKTLPKSH